MRFPWAEFETQWKLMQSKTSWGACETVHFIKKATKVKEVFLSCRAWRVQLPFWYSSLCDVVQMTLDFHFVVLIWCIKSTVGVHNTWTLQFTQRSVGKITTDEPFERKEYQKWSETLSPFLPSRNSPFIFHRPYLTSRLKHILITESKFNAGKRANTQCP